VKFSENGQYLKYMAAFADGKYEAARTALEECLKDFSETTYQRAFLLQRLGEISFLEGHEDQCISYFQSAEAADATSLQPRHAFAEFLARRLKRFDDAVKKCDEILLNATAFPFEETEEDLGSDYYIARANELKAFCEETRNTGNPATS